MIGVVLVSGEKDESEHHLNESVFAILEGRRAKPLLLEKSLLLCRTCHGQFYRAPINTSPKKQSRAICSASLLRSLME